MKASNESTEHNRIIHLSGIKGYNTEMDISIRYVADTGMGLAVDLDNVIIPEIIRSLNFCDNLKCNN